MSICEISERGRRRRICKYHLIRSCEKRRKGTERTKSMVQNYIFTLGNTQDECVGNDTRVCDGSLLETLSNAEHLIMDVDPLTLMFSVIPYDDWRNGTDESSCAQLMPRYCERETFTCVMSTDSRTIRAQNATEKITWWRQQKLTNIVKAQRLRKS